MKNVIVWFTVFSLLLAPIAAQANDIIINVPPMPSGFPKEFPAYKKCKAGGKRQACYGKRGIKKLLLLWHRYGLLQPFPGIARKQQGIIKKQAKLITTRTREAKALRKANKSLRVANKKLSEKTKRDEKRRQGIILRSALISTAVVIVAVLGGIAIGYGIAVPQK